MFQPHYMRAYFEVPVSSLFIIHGIGWDVDYVKDIFDVRGTQFILNVPISMRRPPDSWIWKELNRKILGYDDEKLGFKHRDENGCETASSVDPGNWRSNAPKSSREWKRERYG
nr:uncharacterized protein LOC109158082 [Ipomoea batatas]